MKLLVTGGAGFIGSHFTEYIVETYPEDEIINLDSLTYAGSLDNLENVADIPGHRFVRGSIEDSELVESLASGCDVIVNFAAESHVDRSITGPSVFVRTNIAGTQVLLEAARKNKVSLFCQISTDEVYGAAELDSDEKFTEDTRLNPSSPYSASKAAADLLALSYYTTFGLPVIITRCTNNYGPRQNPEKFLPTVILNASRGKKIPVYGDGRYMRDWIHVHDHCRGVDAVVRRGRPGEIYNISAGNEQMNIDIVRRILALMGKTEELISFVTDRPGHDRRYPVDSTKIRRELGWEPEIGWEQGLRELIGWYTGGKS